VAEFDDGALARLSEDFLTALFETYPTMAAGLGLHDYDGRMPDITESARARRVSSLRGFSDRLAAMTPCNLTAEDAHDHTLVSQAVQEELFELEQLRDFERNPLVVLGPLDVSGYIKRDYAPLERRVRALTDHLRQFPGYLHTARGILRDRVPRPFVETGLEVAAGTLQFHQSDLVRAVRSLPNGPPMEAFERANALATDALRRFIQFLQDDVRPRAVDEFAIGEVQLRAMLRASEMIDLSGERLLEIGRDDLARNQALLSAAAARVDPHHPARDVMARLAQDHPATEQLIPEAERLLEALRAFVQAEGLVLIPPAARCRVEETPPFARWAFAMMDTAGPFEASDESFYYVTPPEHTWTDEQREEWLRKFDYATLQDVGIHEVYPGHFVHFLHMKHIPRAVRCVLTSYAFVEGWAHYCEEMMLDAGYGNADPRLRLAQLAEALLRDVRLLAAIEMHTRGMSEDAAARMFVEEAYLDPLPAKREATRGTFDPGYLNYTLGKLMIKKLRDDLQRQEGDKFSLRGFHDRLLGLGAPPVPLARRRFLSEQDPAL
jgi:uncharacterized protein (DUF885 family)